MMLVLDSGVIIRTMSQGRRAYCNTPNVILKMTKLPFLLEVDEDWPPIALEVLPCERTAQGYRVLSAPLFIKCLSVGDVIDVTLDDVGHVTAWRHVSQSNHTNIWLLRIAKTDEIACVLDRLRSLGCDTVRLEAYGCYAIDVPGHRAIGDIGACLSTLNRNNVAIAYPSFRH